MSHTDAQPETAGTFHGISRLALSLREAFFFLLHFFLSFSFILLATHESGAVCDDGWSFRHMGR